MSYDGYATDPNVINFEAAKEKLKEVEEFFDKGNEDDYYYLDYPAIEEEEREYIEYITSMGLIKSSNERAIKRIENMQQVLFLVSMFNTLILFYLWFMSFS